MCIPGRGHSTISAPYRQRIHLLLAETVRNAICVYWSCHHRYYSQPSPDTRSCFQARRLHPATEERRREHRERWRDRNCRRSLLRAFCKRNHCRLLTRSPKWSRKRLDSSKQPGLCAREETNTHFQYVGFCVHRLIDDCIWANPRAAPGLCDATRTAFDSFHHFNVLLARGTPGYLNSLDYHSAS